MTDAAPWREFICNACGYIYKEQDGDPDSGLAPGTRFEDIPDDWLCPLCGVSKADFEPYDCTAVSLTQGQASTDQRAPQRTMTRVLGQFKSFDVVIVGGGTAAWRLVQAIRALSESITVAVVDAGQAHVYDKPLLSVAIAKGISLDGLVRETGQAASSRLDVDLFAGVHAVSLSATRKVVRTTVGEFHYRYLVLAHGAQPNLIQGIAASVAWRINHLDHYVKFRQALGERPSRLLVVGAGLIGSELSNDLAIGGHQVTLIDQQSRPLGRLLEDEMLSDQLLAAWASLPIQFLGETVVESIQDLGPCKRAVLVKGGVQRTHDIDHVVVAAGLRTSPVLAKSAGLAWSDGYVVDPSTLQASAPDIYAIGDCASIGGQVSRYIEPIARQAQTIASQVVQDAQWRPYAPKTLPIRVKTSSYPITIRP